MRLFEKSFKIDGNVASFENWPTISLEVSIGLLGPKKDRKVYQRAQ